MLNSRLLTPLSNDPNDISTITPARFLIGEVLTSVPQTVVTQINENHLTNFKWYIPNRIRGGMLVLAKDENLVPLFWKLR